MGLDITHGCWSGAYSAFNRWREKLAEVAGMPPLTLIEGHYDPLKNCSFLPSLYGGTESLTSERLLRLDALLPIRYSALKPDKYLHKLLNHPDNHGSIEMVAVISATGGPQRKTLSVASAGPPNNARM